MKINRLIALWVLGGLILLFTHGKVTAQCTQITSGLLRPIGITESNQDNLIVSETGTVTPNTGRISIVEANGTRRTLLSGLPSGLGDVGDPSGPDGIFMRGRTLYVAIGTGDVGRPGPFQGTTIPNPAPISSPIFSSILAIQFSANVEKTTSGFALTPANHQALADGQTLTLSNGGGDKITVKMVADFPNYVPFPLPIFADNIQLSNPFGLTAEGEMLYVSDGGRNLVWQVDPATGAFSPLSAFPSIPNPVFPTFGGPMLDAVPTGITSFGGGLLLTLFRGFPFPPETSTVEQIDPVTGTAMPFISGLRTAIAVQPITERGRSEYLVLQHNSGQVVLPPFAGSGIVLRFVTPLTSPTLLASCLTRPTSMALNKSKSTLYVTELGGGLIAIPIAP